MTTFFIMLVYFLIGIVLAVPYNLLAGGNSQNLMITAWIAPFASLCFYILWRVQREYREKKYHKTVRRILLSFAIYCGLPLILNGASFLAKQTGYTTLAQFLFDWRYGSLLVPIACATFIIGLYVILITLNITLYQSLVRMVTRIRGTSKS